MSLIARLIAALLFFCVAASCSEKNLTGACEKKKILAEIRHRILGVEDYKIEAVVSLEGVAVVSRITGKMPDLLRIRLEIPHPTGLTIVSAVFDGTNQWVETKKSSSTQVIKIDLAGLTTPERPFDTSYYIMGTGLLNGEGYPETIATLLSVYDLKAACSDNVITLSGPINIEKFKEYAAKRRPMGSQQFSIEKFAKVFGYLDLEFDSADLVIKKYTLGSVHGKASFIVQFKDVQTNQGIGNDVFTYSLPSGAVPVDITEDLKDQATH